MSGSRVGALRGWGTLGGMEVGALRGGVNGRLTEACNGARWSLRDCGAGGSAAAWGGARAKFAAPPSRRGWIRGGSWRSSWLMNYQRCEAGWFGELESTSVVVVWSWFVEMSQGCCDWSREARNVVTARGVSDARKVYVRGLTT